MLEETLMVILLVEDDLQVQFFIWKLLKAEGFTVLTAGSGEAALEVCHNYSGAIDLLLTDMEMPRMGGLELWQCIAAERPETKVVIMSGDPQAGGQCAMAGLPFLQKPFQLSAIRECIESIRDRTPVSDEYSLS
jgi:two-component system, cell cycle sensor histidine kinase and response regulator CckA